MSLAVLRHAAASPPSPDPHLGPDNLLVSPSAARWAAMSPEERERYQLASLRAMQEVEAAAQTMSEGAPHARAKTRLLRLIGDHTRERGRSLYMALELPVHYPNERIFSPDLIAVRDVPDPGDDDTRMAWSVLAEGRGPDLALEVLYNGDPQKDLIRNVFRYASLGIPEYIIYLRKEGLLIGYYLPSPDVRSYTMRAPAEDGFLWSDVLELELGIVDGRLELRAEDGQVLDAAGLLGQARDRLSALDARLQARDEALAQAQAQLTAQQAQIDALLAELARLRQP